MPESQQVAPAFSIVLVEDVSGGEVPEPEAMRGQMVAATSSCVAVRCPPESHGPTTITLGRASEVDNGTLPVFDGMVATPNRKLAVRDVNGRVFLEQSVENSEARVRIWADHSTQPGRVAIGVAVR